MRRLLFLLSLFSLYISAFSQLNDSIYKSIVNSHSDSASRFYYLAEKYSKIHIDSSFNYLNKCIFSLKNNTNKNIKLKALLLKSNLLFSKGKRNKSQLLLDSSYNACLKSNIPELILLASNYKGRQALFTGHLDSAVIYYEKLNHYSKQFRDTISLVKSLNNLGTVELYRGLYRQALRYYIECLKIAEARNEIDILGSLYSNIGTIYQTNSEFHKALKMYYKAESLANKTSNMELLAMSQNNIGVCNRNLSEPNKYLNYSLKALDSFNKLSDANGKTTSLANVGYAYWYLNDNEKSKSYLAKAEQMALETHNEQILTTIYQFISRIYLNSKELSKAYLYINKGLKLSQKHKILHMESVLTDYLRQYYALKGNYKQAYQYQSRYGLLKDSLLDKDNKEYMARVTAEYEADRKEQENQILKIKNEVQEKENQLQYKRNTILVVIISLVVLSLIVIGVLLFIRTRSSQKLSVLNTELEKANETKDQFFSIISHDLRGPFTAILGFAILSQQALEDNEKQHKLRKYLRVLHETTEGTLKLLNDILEWAKTQMGKMEFHPSTLDLNKEINDVIQYSNGMCAEKEIELNIDIPVEFRIWADSKMLSLILRNLINNAVKFSYERSEIRVKATETKNETIISIRDFGLGMHESQVEALFKIDQITSTPGTRKEKGTGLGLVLCKEFIDLHNGQIQVKSELNKGSEFTIVFPKRN